jgi:hypothetical protein
MLRIVLASLALSACATQPQYRLDVVGGTTLSRGQRVVVLVTPLDDPEPMPVGASLEATPPGIIEILNGEQIIGVAPGDAKLTASVDSWSDSVMLHVN